MVQDYDSPFTYFGNKKHVAADVWSRFGAVKSYYEPFFGTGSMFFSSPYMDTIERAVLNDLDGMVANFWRSVKFSLQETACYCDMGQHEIELHARLLAVWKEIGQITHKLVEDVSWHDPKLAGYWATAMSADLVPRCGTGGGPWALDDKGRLHKRSDSAGMSFSKPNADRKNCIRWAAEGTVEASLLSLHTALTRAYVLCGDWQRCFIEYQLRETPIGVFFDPPYDEGVNKISAVYKQSKPITSSIKDWATKFGAKVNFRIAICGYSGEYDSLVAEHGWEEFKWKGTGGYGKTGKSAEAVGMINRHKETIWFSPYCLKPSSQSFLF